MKTFRIRKLMDGGTSISYWTQNHWEQDPRSAKMYSSVGAVKNGLHYVKPLRGGQVEVEIFEIVPESCVPQEIFKQEF